MSRHGGKLTKSGRTLVDTDQNVSMRTKGDSSNIFAVLEGEGEGLVTVQRNCELIASAALV
jgi:hypothetical protein